MTLNDKDQDLANALAPLVTDLRSRRKPIDVKWLQWHDTWRDKDTRSFFVSEMFKHNIPMARRSVERFVVKVAQMLVPTPGDYFEVFPLGEQDDNAGKAAEGVRAYMFFVMSKRIKAYALARELARCYALYGRCIAKSGIQIVDAVQQGQKTKHVWPTARAVDPFIFYVWPETVTSADQASIIVEDNYMSWETYQSLVDRGVVEKIDQKDLGRPIWPDTHIQRLQMSGITEPSATMVGRVTQDGSINADKQEIYRFVALSEVWIRREGTWHQVMFVWNHVTPFKVVRHEKGFAGHRYRMAVARAIPGEHYTTGMMDDLGPLQSLLNDQWNMTLEGQATSFSPPAVINPDLVSRASTIVYRPRAKWLMDPAGVKFLEVSQGRDTVKAGLMGIQTTMNLMDTFSGSSPLAEGTPTRNMPRAGFAVSSLMTLALSDLKDAAMMIENEVMTPLLGDIYALTKEYMPQTQIMRIPGTQNFPSMTLGKDDIDGDFEFNWVGSIQASDYQTKAQRLITVLGSLTQLEPLVLQDLQARGKRINWEALFKRIWRDGLGERGADSIIEDLTPQEMTNMAISNVMGQMKPAAGVGPLPGSPTQPPPEGLFP